MPKVTDTDSVSHVSITTFHWSCLNFKHTQTDSGMNSMHFTSNACSHTLTLESASHPSLLRRDAASIRFQISLFLWLDFRDPPAVTRLTVYCWLHIIPVKVWFGPALGGNYVWDATCYLYLTFDISDRFSWNQAWITRNCMGWLIFAVTLPPMHLTESYSAPRKEICVSYFHKSWITISHKLLHMWANSFHLMLFLFVSLLYELSQQ